MMNRRFILALLVTLIASVVAVTYAQNDNPNAVITSPPVVSLLRGVVPIEGTANVPEQTGYFIQYRALDDSLTPIGGENALWSPATTLVRATVQDDLLSEWDTTIVPDGLYQLQLVVNSASNEPARYTVAAVRVQNEDVAFAGGRFEGEAVAGAVTATPLAPQINPTPTSRATAAPRQVTATATIQANVRLGDSTIYPPVGFLEVGETVPIIGRSGRSTWVFVRLDDGTEGFISPSTIRINGELIDVPVVDVPPPPFTPTFTPSPTPVVRANLIATEFRLSENNPDCNEAFEVIVVVQNVGTGPTNASGSIAVADRYLGSGQVTESSTGGFPVLSAGERFEVRVPLTVDTFFEERHRIEVTIDSNGVIQETNEGDNFVTRDYTLEVADCAG